MWKRTLAIVACSGMMCFALAGCGDDTPQGAGQGQMPQVENGPQPPDRAPGSNQPPSVGQGDGPQ